jgi:hypothetical protein
MRFRAILTMTLTTPVILFGQMSGYVSVSGSQDANPLCNYQQLSDRLFQSYLLLNLSSAGSTTHLRVQYEGGMTLFNQFELRNYLDHTLRARFLYRPSPSGPSIAAPGLSDTRAPSLLDEGEEQETDSMDAAADSLEEEANYSQGSASDEQTPFDPDSDTLAGVWETALSLGARHNKDAFADFNNVGGDFTFGYTFDAFRGLRFQIVNRLTIRSYPGVEELSNWTENLSLLAAGTPGSQFHWSIEAVAGWKMYIRDQYDSTKYEPVKTYSYAPGKGKLGGIIKVPSGKVILLDASAKNTAQLTAELQLGYRSEPFHSLLKIRYRYNPSPGSRTIVQNQSASLLTDDLYNEYFSYGGPEGELQLGTNLIWDIRVNILGEIHDKKYSVPAMMVTGDELPELRRDMTTRLGIQFSRSITVGSQSIEVSLMSSFVQNQTNDEYNNFTGTQIGLGLGYGF